MRKTYTTLLITLICVVNLFSNNPIIPNTFTPNNDNINEEFVVNLNGIDVYEYKMKIFNRWGVEVFNSSNENINWNGRSPADSKVTSGSYYYYFILNNIKYSGIINLFR